MAQTVQEFSFSREIKGVEFENASIMKYVLEPDKSIIYLELSRVGAVNPKWNIWSGGGDPVEIKALGILELSKDLKLLNERARLREAGRHYFKQYKLLKEPGNVTSSKTSWLRRTIAWVFLILWTNTRRSCRQRTPPKGPCLKILRQLHRLRGLGKKVKGFNSGLYRLKPEGQKRPLCPAYQTTSTMTSNQPTIGNLTGAG